MVAFIKSVAVLAFAALAAAAPGLDASLAKRGDFIQGQSCGNNKVVTCCNNQKTDVDASKDFIDALKIGDAISGLQCLTANTNAGAGILGAAIPIQNTDTNTCSDQIACCQQAEGDKVSGLIAVNVDANCNIIGV